MAKIFLIISIAFLNLLPCKAATEFSRFAAKQYAASCGLEKAHITVKNEHLEKLGWEMGDDFVPFVVYGYGDLKSKNHKKQRVTYICLLNFAGKPVWSYINFGK